MAKSNKSVSIEPANAGKNKTEFKIEPAVKQKTIASVWKHFGFKADEKGKPQLPDRPKCHIGLTV